MAILKVRDNDGNIVEIPAIKGDKGDKGDTGADGYTPVRGTDYFTEADIAEVVAQVGGLPHLGTLTGDINDVNLAQGIYEIMIYPAPNGILFGTFININGNGSNGLQIAIAGNADPLPGSMCIRNLSGPGFGEWEWVNPPMTLGVEYRTMEKYQGKPVYTKLVDLGALPDSSSKSVSTGLSYTDKIVRCEGYIDDGTPAGANGMADVYVSTPTMIIVVTTSPVFMFNATARIWYTKN